VDTADGSELKALLVGVELPAEKGELLEYAVRQHAEPALLEALTSLPDEEFHSLDDIVERLAPADRKR
jgi:Protein of unknown function (DUF2795)